MRAARAVDEEQQHQQREEGALNDRDEKNDGESHALRRDRSNQEGTFAMRIRRFTGFDT